MLYGDRHSALFVTPTAARDRFHPQAFSSPLAPTALASQFRSRGAYFHTTSRILPDQLSIEHTPIRKDNLPQQPAILVPPQVCDHTACSRASCLASCVA